MLFFLFGCNRFGSKKETIASSMQSENIIKNHQVPDESLKNKNFKLRSEGSNFIIIFPSGKEVKTDDYNPILSQIPSQAIKYDYLENDGNGRSRYNYRNARIDFTKIDRQTKLNLTANMHFEFQTDVDSLLYAEYNLNFPYDTTTFMPDIPEIQELLIIYARCWNGCHKGEHSMEIQIGSLGNLVRFDRQGNKIAEFYSDRFGNGKFSNDLKYYGGSVGGFYSDGGGFYRKTRAYIYDTKTKEIVFHKLIDFGKDVQFFYVPSLNKWRLHIDEVNDDEHTYIDPNTKFQYKYILNEELKNKFLKEDLSGYYFKDGISKLFERDFEKTSLIKIATPYP
jgi:hypothetical protein